MKTTLALLTALLLASVPTMRAADAPKQKPNVLFVVFDDLNNRLGCYGDPVAKSPNLDRLAARGTLFTRNFCQQPICGPSRASFMSGRRPDSLGITSMTKYLYDLHPDAVTIPQWFMQHGYTSMSIGKVLGGYGKEADFKMLSVPDRRTGGKTKDEFQLPSGVALPPNLAKDSLCENRDVPDEACFDAASASLAITELRALAKKPEPFFLALGIFKPHSPYKVPKRYWDMYRLEDIPAIETPTRPRNAPEIAFHANHEILGEPNAPRTLDEEAKREIRHGYYAAMSFADAQFGRVLDALQEFNADHAALHPENSNLAARIASYELAFNMQRHAPEAVDLTRESAATRRLYGLDDPRTEEFGRRCLLARRLVERGVRFIQLYAGGAHNDDNWDAHTDIEKNHNFHAGRTDKPIAGLIQDLKQRGMLEETLIVWGGEFGRQPTAEYEKGTGRDHNAYGFTMWMAGGGVKGGVSHGQTDDIGANAVEHPLHVKDLHATVLHLMGLDPNHLSFFHGGLDQKLVGVEEVQPIRAIL